MISFLEPLLIRWRERNLCAYCKRPMVAKCKTHRIAICDARKCYDLHRLKSNGIRSGELTRPRGCLFMKPVRPLIIVRNCAICLAFGILYMLVVIW